MLAPPISFRGEREQVAGERRIGQRHVEVQAPTVLGESERLRSGAAEQLRRIMVDQAQNILGGAEARAKSAWRDPFNEIADLGVLVEDRAVTRQPAASGIAAQLAGEAPALDLHRRGTRGAPLAGGVGASAAAATAVSVVVM
jgi:hypothetical protein